MNKYFVIGLVFVVILIILGAVLMSNNSKTTSNSNINNKVTLTPTYAITNTPSASISATISPKAETTISATGSALGTMDIKELKIEDLKVGTGVEAKIGTSVTVNYKGTLTNGTQFDSSYDRGQPFTFSLGAGDVIKGWDQGVAGMKIGGKRKLTIPPDLAYGARALPGIPANSTLVFEVELLKVE